MLLSMTGFGRARGSYQDKTISIELRSLNSKFTDLRFKLPQNYKDKEPDLRKIVTKAVERGKIEMTIDVLSNGGDGEFALNKPLFKKYFSEITKLNEELGISNGDLNQTILRLPNVVSAESSTIDDEEWEQVKSILDQALTKFTNFRKAEGAAMETDCINRVNSITSLLEKVDPFETNRVEKLRKRMLQNMEEYVGKENIDANRFEQEILYYLEKIDITEEKVRLAQHCKYFLEVLQESTTQKGRKLGFISQEIGREINTLGSKANSSDIQRFVVKMKDELEKIKEQVLNTL